MSNIKFSPLFWPVKLKGNCIYIVDETSLPQKLAYIKIKNYKQAVKAIKEMKTRAVGQVILVFYIFLQAAQQEKNRKNLAITLKTIAKAINRARPTLSFKFLTDMVLGWVKEGIALEPAINGFLKRLKAGRIMQAREASRLIRNRDVILTHCNVSGLLPLMSQFAKAEGKHIKFFVTETRPYLQGSRLTSWELERAGFDVTLIIDSAVAHIMDKGMVNKVMVGADNLAGNGDIANKIGTYQLAALAKKFNIPFYVFTPPPSRLKTGKDINIEIRSPEEIFTISGKRIAPTGIKGYYPAFDITPARLITKYIPLKI